MRFLRLRLFSVLIAVLVIPSPGNAESYRDAANHFQLEVPNNWRTLTADELARFNTGAKNTPYDGAFRPVDKFFGSAPYILYLVHRGAYTGASYEDIERDIASSTKTVLIKDKGESAADIFNNLRVGEGFLDRDRNRLYMRSEVDIGLGEKTQVFSDFHLGSAGSVQVIGYALANEVAEFVPQFVRMNESFRFDPGFQFKPFARPPTADPQRSNLIAAITVVSAVAVALCGLLIYSVQRRRKFSAATGGGLVRSLITGCIVFLLFFGFNVAAFQRLPDVDRLTAIIFDFLLASVLIGFLTLKRAWPRRGTAVAILVLGVGFFIVSSFWFVERSRRDLVVQEQWLQDCIALYKECGDVLENVHDKDSATRAVPQLDACVRRFDHLAEQAKTPIDVSKEDKERLKRRYMAELAKQAQRVIDNAQKTVDKARGEPAFEDAIERLHKAYMKLRNS